ncbi:DUF3137 domain-containing protein [Gordonia sp. CPCC 205333]|uniref:DUF3137 domain-containing protein n=1 Tax=Gordonia sp. CPCC 205333 TaxID=3140790 RepID=UPI003AF386DC
MTAVIICALLAMCIAFAIAAIVGARRSAALESLATEHGFSYIGDDSRYAKRFSGRPFRTWGGKVHDLVSGQYRGRDFAVFDYHYTTSSGSGDNSTKHHHHFTVWAIELACSVPRLEVGSEGIFGGKVAEFFGAERIRSGDATFDNRFKVSADDAKFAHAVLSPDLVAHMNANVGQLTWRFDGDVMISFEKGRFTADSGMVNRLDVMCDILDTIGDETWPSRRHSR